MADQQDSDSEVNFNMNHRGRGDEEAQDGDSDYEAEGRDHRRRVLHVKPDTYTGDEDWDQYISYFEDCAELAQWSEKEKLLYLATALKQQARLHYSSLPAHEKRSYRVLTERLEQRFGSKRQATRWLSKIQTRTLGKNESVAAFGDEIRLYAQKAYVSLGPEAQEMLALEHFFKSFSPEVRCRLMDKGCRTIREAVEIVERYEDVLGRANTSAGMSHIRTISNSKEGSGCNKSTESQDVSDLGGVKSAIKRIEERLEKLEASDRKGSTGRTCFTCGSRDHLYRKCPNRGTQKGKFHQNQGNSKPSRQ